MLHSSLDDLVTDFSLTLAMVLIWNCNWIPGWNLPTTFLRKLAQPCNHRLSDKEQDWAYTWQSFKRLNSPFFILVIVVEVRREPDVCGGIASTIFSRQMLASAPRGIEKHLLKAIPIPTQNSNNWKGSQRGQYFPLWIIILKVLRRSFGGFQH